MRPSIRLLLTGAVLSGALSYGAAGAWAQNSANGPDAGIGIEGYNLDYAHSADGSGPGYPRHPTAAPHYKRYSYHNPHHYRRY